MEFLEKVAKVLSSLSELSSCNSKSVYMISSSKSCTYTLDCGRVQLNPFFKMGVTITRQKTEEVEEDI
jgi:hypothetical protein